MRGNKIIKIYIFRDGILPGNQVFLLYRQQKQGRNKVFWVEKVEIGRNRVEMVDMVEMVETQNDGLEMVEIKMMVYSLYC